MAVQPSPHDVRLLKGKVYFAAKNNEPEVIRNSLASPHPDVVKDVLHHCSTDQGLGSTPLIISALNGHLEVVELLVIEFNVDINQKASGWFTHPALISAVSQGHLDIVKALVTKGCDISVAGSSGYTAVTLVCFHNHLSILKYLVKNGAPIDDSSKCFIYSCRKRSWEMVEYLLSKGADPNKQDADKKTALHLAAKSGASDIIELLLHHGARFSKDRYGRSPLMEAAVRGFSKAVNVFLECIDLSQMERIEALELLEASLAGTDVDEAFRYVSQAMQERYKNPSEVLIKPCSPLPTLSNVQESQTREELQARRSDWHLFRLECLAIMSRSLGPEDYCTIDSFNHYFDQFQSAGCLNEVTAVWLHTIKAALRSTRDPRGRLVIVDILCSI